MATQHEYIPDESIDLVDSAEVDMSPTGLTFKRASIVGDDGSEQRKLFDAVE